MAQEALAADDPVWLSPGDPGLQAWVAPEPGVRPDLWPAGLSRDKNGELGWRGVGVASLLARSRARTPVFVLDLDDFRARSRSYREAFAQFFGRDGAQVHYAAKAFLCLELARVAVAEGLGLDTASGGELTLALASGCEPGLVGLHGNGKSADLLHFALTAGIGRIIVDSLGEILRLQRVLDVLPQSAVVPVMVRLTTGVHAGGHEFIATAHEDQKFGLSVEPGTVGGLCPQFADWIGGGVEGFSPQDSPALAAVKMILADDRLELRGLHSHIGSQIAGFGGFAQSARRVLQFRGQVLRETGYLVPEIDLGGGYGVAYTGAMKPGLVPHEVAQGLYQAVKNACAELEQPLPFVSVEPGRSLVAPTTVTFYRVVNVKDQPVGTRANGSVVYRRYVTVDGGMSDNIRPALYGAQYTAAVANRVSGEPLVGARVVGSHCESGDIVVRNVALPADLTEGDWLAVPMTGAYGWSMSSNYNCFARPGVLGVTVCGEPGAGLPPAGSLGASLTTGEFAKPDKSGTVVTKWLVEAENTDSMLAHFDPEYRKYLDSHPSGTTEAERKTD